MLKNLSLIWIIRVGRQDSNLRPSIPNLFNCSSADIVFQAFADFLLSSAQFVQKNEAKFVNYSSTFIKSSNKLVLLSKPRKIDFLESLKKNPNFC